MTQDKTATAVRASSLERLVRDGCPNCGNTVFKPGIAIRNTFTGIPDFPGDKYAVTVSPGGPGRMTDCWKCCQCGYSVSMIANTKIEGRAAFCASRSNDELAVEDSKCR